jgi:hypothetical protein
MRSATFQAVAAFRQRSTSPQTVSTVKGIAWRNKLSRYAPRSLSARRSQKRSRVPPCVAFLRKKKNRVATKRNCRRRRPRRLRSFLDEAVESLMQRIPQINAHLVLHADGDVWAVQRKIAESRRQCTVTQFPKPSHSFSTDQGDDAGHRCCSPK